MTTMIGDQDRIRSRAFDACAIVAVATIIVGAAYHQAFTELVSLVAAIFLACAVLFARLQTGPFSLMRFALVAIGSAVAYSVSSGIAEDLIYTVPMFVMAALVGAAYQWRDARYHEVRDTGWPTVADTAKHLAGYALGLSAGILSYQLLSRWRWEVAGAGMVTAFLCTKFAVDFIVARPVRVAPVSLTILLRDLTIISPFWWGLPIGAVVYTLWVLLTLEEHLPLGFALIESAPEFYKTATAITLVFGALTLVAAALESFRFGPTRLERPDEPLRDYLFGTLTFVAVAGLAMSAFVLNFEPFLTFEDTFGTETWTCARGGAYADQIGWIPKASGLTFFIDANGIAFFDLSCVPKKNGCDYVDEGWSSVDIVVEAPTGHRDLKFDRKSPGQTETRLHHAYLSGHLAQTVSEVFRAGTRADIRIYGPKTGLLYVQHVNLNGFGQALDQCRARWWSTAHESAGHK